jgi:hypothetical protein
MCCGNVIDNVKVIKLSVEVSMDLQVLLSMGLKKVESWMCRGLSRIENL